jgi:hypothetical protein
MHKMPTEQTEKIHENQIAINIQQLMLMLGCGRATAERIANEADAVFYIGKRKLYKPTKIRAWVDNAGNK